VRLAAIAVVLLALAIRLVVVFATPHYVLRADPIDYERHAKAIARGHYPPPGPGIRGETAYRPPLYPLFLGAIYTVTPGDSREWARVAQAFLGTITVALTGLLALQLLGSRAGLVALGIAAVLPSLWMVGSALLSEVLLAPLVLGATCAALHHRLRDPRLRWMVLAGALAGLATLTRQNAALVLVPLLLAAFPPAGRRRSGRAYAAVGVTVLAAALTVAPWTVRNAAALDHFVPVSTQDGYTLAGTYNDVARAQKRFPAAWVPWFSAPENLRVIRRTPNTEVQWGDALRSHALRYAREHPGYVVKVAWWNLRRDLDLAGRDWVRFDLGITATPRLVDREMVTYWVVGLLGLGGALTRPARRAPGWVWLVPISMLATVFVVGYQRFRAPVDPFVTVLAALGLLALSARISARIRPAGLDRH
jgi:4-amino-4-deoxy-L-arabinose transferase-like glycosyltransferase